ncbi:MAG: DNA mismatch repair protein MutS, partial [Clostridia bacterium]|nr:DNA mismatch repair protein MutS [Clostridia bacterium]
TVFRPAAGALFLLVMLAVNIFVYYRKKPAIESQLITMRYISSLMLCVKRLLRLKTDGLKDYTARLAKLYAPLKKAGRAGTLLTGTGSDLDFLFEYFKLILMLDFIVYSRVLSLIEHRGAEFREAYAIIGQLDAAVSVVSYRRSLSYYCVPEFTGSESLELEEMYHPLLKKPVPNSVTLRRSVLVTGSNASGKSTFVKAVAVNAIFAQTIHTCLARSFRLKPSFVVTSMAVGDDIEAGESYYVAEVRSLRRMIARLSPETRCLCFIDEILRGTNTIERIAASAAILDYLRSRNCLVLAATHDIELTEITAAYFDNYHFREHVSGRGIRFDYKIHEGWATTKNAIRLLEFMEYDRSITSEASMLAEGFEKSRSWERLP